MVCDHQWNPLVVASPCPWSESIFSPDVRHSINLVLEKGGFVAMQFDSFDFSTLYTNIPHDLLLACLEILIKEAYKVRGATYKTIGRHTGLTLLKYIERAFLWKHFYVILDFL